MPSVASSKSENERGAPRVCVVVPAYNAAWSIRDTVLSIKNQRLEDFECVIVDDGSTEDIGPSVLSAVGSDQRFRIARRENGGLASARNFGYRFTTAPYTAFIDSDDLWHPDFLYELVQELEQNKLSSFAYAHSYRIDLLNQLLPVGRWKRAPRHDLRGLLEVNTAASGSAAVFRTSVLRDSGGFDTSFRDKGAEGAEDWHLLLRLAEKHTPLLVHKYLSVYRINPSSMSFGNPERQLNAVNCVLNDIHRRFPFLREQSFRNARTTINGWLLCAVVRRLGWARGARLCMESYFLNPFWFLSRDLRRLHVMKIQSLILSFKRKSWLSEMREANGDYPFSFLKDAALESGLTSGEAEE